MSLDPYILQFRGDADERMQSRGTLWRKTDETATNDDGYDVPEWEVVHLSLRCRIGSDRGAGTTRRIQMPDGGDVQVATRTAHFPADSYDLADDDFLEIISGENVDTVWRLVETDFADQQTARRCPIVAVDRPEEWS